MVAYHRAVIACVVVVSITSLEAQNASRWPWRSYVQIVKTRSDTGQGDFKNAAAEFQAVLPAHVRQNSTIPRMLAEAYLALGEEARAAQVLRLVRPAEEVPRELDRLRRALRNRGVTVP